jgi:hypothetical protein
MSSEHIDELVDLAALDALTPDERSRVQAHAMLCPVCRMSLAEAREVAAKIGFSVPLHAAPPLLRGRVLAAAGIVPAAELPAQPRRPSRLPLPLITRMTTRWGALAAALVVAPLAGLLTWAVILQSQVNDLRQENRQIQEAQRGVVLLADPASLRDRMQPTDAAPSARGRVLWNPDDGTCAVVARGLPKPDAGVTYHVFYQGMKGVVNAGELRVDDEGSGELVFDASKWRGDEYRVWVSPVRGDQVGSPLLKATLRRD